MRSKHLRTLYWTATLLFALPHALSALHCLLGAPIMAHVIASLGYPDYFLKLLAAAKLAGIAAILSGRSAVLKEWAYAGFTFEAVAAVFSFLSTGNALHVVALPAGFLAVQFLSYWSWQRLEARNNARTQAQRRVRAVIPASASAMRGYY